MKEKLKFVHKKKEKQTENGLTERLSGTTAVGSSCPFYFKKAEMD